MQHCLVVSSFEQTGAGMCNVTPQDTSFRGDMGALTPDQYAALGRTITVTGLTSGNYTAGGSFSGNLLHSINCI
jgi:hypothetical protein